MQIAPDMIVRHGANGRYYRVRSVSRTRAVCCPCTKTGLPPASGQRATAVEFDQSDLVPRREPKPPLEIPALDHWPKPKRKSR